MSFFNRGPPAPGPGQRASPSPYTRLPDGSQTSLPPRAPRPPPPRFDDPSGYEKRSFDQRRPPPSGVGGTFAVQACPSDALALTNCLIVHPADFRDGEHVLVKGEFPITVRHDNTGRLSQGAIGPSAVQRQWIGLSTTGDTVTRNLEIAEQFSADDLAATFIRGFSHVVFTIGQILVFEYHGQNLKCVVKSVSVLELPSEQRRGGLPGASGGPGGGRVDSGIVMEKTDVTFLKDPISKIKIKSSAKKAAPNAILAPNFKFADMGIGGLDQEFSAIFRRAFASRVFPPGLVEKLGIQHVKGILLHGPPGTGKTLMARQIGKMLNAREPKIVNGPEILNKFVGQSEENIRKLFADAEKEQRGSTNTGTGVGDTVVNQLLSKMDGVDQLNNILIIGMTNRLDMIDEAYQILNIHTVKMRNNGVMDSDVDLKELAKQTKNFSGAEIGGLVGTMAGISDDVENLRNGIIHYDTVVDVRSFSLFGSASFNRYFVVPFIKLITPDNMVGFSEAQKIQAISKVFADSSKSPLSVVVVDNIERLLDWTPVGPRFSNAVLQTLMVLMAKRPPKGRRLLVIATSSLRPMLTDVGLSSFDAELRVPPITDLNALDHVLEAVELFRHPRDRARAVGMLRQAGMGAEEGRLSIGVKRLLSVIEMARQEPEAVAERLTSALMGLGM
ncbi:hypothetical protein BC826DRAFT_1043220 [Russula brevipes]|nr:hypothetical protein BC826DRAFT_1043220 [Russula brevipes]